MRGSPLLNAILAFLAIAVLGIPVHRLTRADATTAATAATTPAAPVADTANVPIEFRFTTPPANVKIRHLGKVVWSADEPGSSAEAEVSLPWPAEGVDLLFEVGWPDDAPLSAARVVVTTPAGDEHTRSIWGTGPATEVFTFR